MEDKTLIELEDAARNARDAARKADEMLRQAQRKADLDKRRELRPIAQRAHDAFCRWNHTDGCSWIYETHVYVEKGRPTEDEVWASDTHARWLDRVAEAVKRIPVEKLDAVLATYEAMKQVHPEAGNIIEALRK